MYNYQLIIFIITCFCFEVLLGHGVKKLCTLQVICKIKPSAVNYIWDSSLGHIVYPFPPPDYFLPCVLSCSVPQHFIYLLIFKFIYLFIYFWLRWVFVAVRGLLFVAVHRLLIAVASLCCGAQALGTQASVVVAPELQSAGSVVVAHGLS